MPKQRYELEIEDILRKYEEEAVREQAQRDARPSGTAPSLLYKREIVSLGEMERENFDIRPAKESRPRLSSGQLATLGSIALLAGLLASFLNVGGPLLLLIFLGLGITAACASVAQKN